MEDILTDNPAQAITPPVRKNVENELYRTWKDASTEVRPSVEHRLLQHLRRHAAKVCWLVLHSHQLDLVNEIAQDAIMQLGQFEERSAFSTWFHSRALNRCREELRRQKIRKEVPLNADWIPRDSGLETKAIVQELWANLDEQEKELVQLKVIEGHSDEEVAEIIDRSRQWVQAAWSQLRKRLREKYASKVRK